MMLTTGPTGLLRISGIFWSTTTKFRGENISFQLGKPTCMYVHFRLHSGRVVAVCNICHICDIYVNFIVLYRVDSAWYTRCCSIYIVMIRLPAKSRCTIPATATRRSALGNSIFAVAGPRARGTASQTPSVILHCWPLSSDCTVALKWFLVICGTHKLTVIHTHIHRNTLCGDEHLYRRAK